MQCFRLALILYVYLFYLPFTDEDASVGLLFEVQAGCTPEQFERIAQFAVAEDASGQPDAGSRRVGTADVCGIPA